MLRHAENCVGYDVVDEENGTPTPKRGRRGRKRKMQSRKDDDDDDTGNLMFVFSAPEDSHKKSLKRETEVV